MAALFLRPSPIARRTSTFPGRLEALPSTQLRLKTPSDTARRRPFVATAAAAAAGASGEVEGVNGHQEKNGGKGDDSMTIDEIKAAFYEAIEGINRGIFGATSAKKSEIISLVEQMETRNPTAHPTDDLRDKVEGCWKLLYSTISILGVKRTKLGLREFISLGDFLQTIDVAEERAINSIKFNVKGLRMISGQLTIVAHYSIASKTRVDIKLESSSITPKQLMDIFEKNYDLLLGIFNPEGWLEITFVDDSMRIGRDDKGNIFVLEKTDQTAT